MVRLFNALLGVGLGLTGICGHAAEVNTPAVSDIKVVQFIGTSQVEMVSGRTRQHCGWVSAWDL
jgi:hypothetical protein